MASRRAQLFPSFLIPTRTPESKAMFLFDLLQDFLIEIVRALLVEGVLRRVQKRKELRAARRRRRRLIEQALHKLATERRANR